MYVQENEGSTEINLTYNLNIQCKLICTLAINYFSRTVGLKLDLANNTDDREARSLHYRRNYIQVYSNSWGPSDLGFIAEKPGVLLENTFEYGVKKVMLIIYI